MDIELAIKEISRLKTLYEKLTYYNNNFCSLIEIGNYDHTVGFGIARPNEKLICFCKNCLGKYSITDFLTYSELRNKETQRVLLLFKSISDYKSKVEYYFDISKGYSKTKRVLYYVPENIEEINTYEFPYKTAILDITPVNEIEINILKNYLRQKLLNDNNSYMPMAQFTFEKRVEMAQKYLAIRKEKSRREEFILAEYDKIKLSKIVINTKNVYDKTLNRILLKAEDIIKSVKYHDYSDIEEIKIYILAEDVIKYEKFLNGILNVADISIKESSTKNPRYKNIDNNYLNKDNSSKIKIDKNLLDKIQLSRVNTKYKFGTENDNNLIVPQELEHSWLLKNFKIDQSIINYYYLPNNDFISPEYYKQLTECGYMGKIDSTLQPYSIEIFGAYYARKDIFYKLQSLQCTESITLNNSKINYFDDLIPYFMEYSDGFKSGYNNFEKNCIEPYLLHLADKNDYVNKVFEYITKDIITEHSWLNNYSGFTLSYYLDDKSKSIVEVFNNGKKQGYMYRAWCIVFGSNNLFTNLFRNVYQTTYLSQIEHKLAGINSQKDAFENTITKKPKKITDKWYALLYLVEVEVYKKEIPTNFEGAFIKSEIEEIGKQKCNSTGQGFYRHVKDLKGKINSNINVKRHFNDNWKDVIIELSNNDENIIKYLETFYK